MKYTLEFNIPDEQTAFIDAVNGSGLKSILNAHISRLEELTDSGRKSEARVAEELLDELQTALKSASRLP